MIYLAFTPLYPHSLLLLCSLSLLLSFPSSFRFYFAPTFSLSLSLCMCLCPLQGTATGGYKRGAKLAVAGIFGGIAAKYIGDWTYSSMRSSWISYRRLTLMESRPRILETKPKMRRPKEGEYFSPREVVTVGMFEWPTWGMATKSPDSEHFKTFPSSKDSDSESGSREKK